MLGEERNGVVCSGKHERRHAVFALCFDISSGFQQRGYDFWVLIDKGGSHERCQSVVVRCFDVGTRFQESRVDPEVLIITDSHYTLNRKKQISENRK